MKRRIAAGIAVLIVAGSPMVSAAESLGDALADAYRNSGLLEQNRALLRAADEDVATTLSQLRPILNWTASLSRNFGTNRTNLGSSGISRNEVSLGLSAELLIYDGGESQLAMEAAKETVLATRQTLVSIEQQVLLEAVNAFMNVRRDSETVALRQNNLRLITRELRAAEDRFEVGEVTRTDVALAEARLAGARAELAVAQGNLMQSREQYAAAVGREPGSLTPPPRLPTLANSLDEAKAVAVRTHPEIRSVQHQVSAAELNVARNEATMSPTVKLRGSYGLTEQTNSSDYSRGGSVSLDLTQPIYQGGRISALVRKAMAQRDAQRANLHVAGLSVRQQVGNAWANLLSSRAQIEASQRQVQAAQIAFEGVREEATLGARTTLDVLNAEQELLNARSNLISAQSGQIVAAYSVLSTMGLLTADHLNLNVEQYDPLEYYNQVKTAPTSMSRQGRQLDKLLKRLGKE
ncbi:TolC family outer membrane protein [Salinihabitans flavidus]|uniref:TolC family outer membrane protein n=1 Tax=Salinihabitans flavidus TaxID=569882 RepID=UPI001FDF4BB5|nr:TolC family outer membrane protein [Salinihabitans flavidus]